MAIGYAIGKWSSPCTYCILCQCHACSIRTTDWAGQRHSWNTTHLDKCYILALRFSVWVCQNFSCGKKFCEHSLSAVCHTFQAISWRFFYRKRMKTGTLLDIRILPFQGHVSNIKVTQSTNFVFLCILGRTQGRKDPKFGMLMYHDHIQSWFWLWSIIDIPNFGAIFT